jgi:sugar phosphate isomerase/epimerase
MLSRFSLMQHDPTREAVRIGTLARGGERTAAYIREILPHGFESFQINFWRTLAGVNLEKLARLVGEVLAGSGAVISSLGIYGNPLEASPEDAETLRGWEACVDHAHLFGAQIVGGFTGRLRGKPLPESIPQFKKVFGELARRAADKGVRIAFENCWMGGDWRTGDWNIALCPDAWELMFDSVPADNLGLEWEPCHQLCELIDPMPQLHTWVPKIFHVHGKDATVHWDLLRRHGRGGAQRFAYHRHPGFGDSNWTDIISQLRMHGFAGSIDIEGWHDPVYKEDLEMTGQVHALHYLKQCRGGSFVPNPS